MATSAPQPIADYAGLKTYALSADILYGSIATRGTELSLGVNLLPPDVKVCSLLHFDCANFAAT